MVLININPQVIAKEPATITLCPLWPCGGVHTVYVEGNYHPSRPTCQMINAAHPA